MLLLDKVYWPWDTSRDAQGAKVASLHRLGVCDRARCITLVPEDFRSIRMAMRKSEPDELDHLAGQGDDVRSVLGKIA